MCTVNTVMGPVAADALGRTLMHEHVFVQYGGAAPEYRWPGPQRDAIVAACCERAARIRDFGVATVVDPTTCDLGRNVELLAEVSERSGINLVCATGIYSTATYRVLRDRLGGPRAITALFVSELTEGIDGTSIRAGVIKVVTGRGPFSADEHELLLAAAAASVASGAPIITHTEGVRGEEQQRVLTDAGVPARHILVGHSCLSTDFTYHHRVLRGGSYLGFDRFGMEGDLSDEVRAEALLKLLQAGFAGRLMVSHDSVWHWVDGPAFGAAMPNWHAANFFQRVIPMLHYGGASDSQIETLLRENPRRFFAGEVVAGAPA